MKRRMAAWTAAGALAVSVGLVGAGSALAAPSHAATAGSGHGAPVTLVAARKGATSRPLTPQTKGSTPSPAKSRAVSGRLSGKTVDRDRLGQKSDRDTALRSAAARARDRVADRQPGSQRLHSTSRHGR